MFYGRCEKFVILKDPPPPHSSCNKLQGQFLLLVPGFLMCMHTCALSSLILLCMCWLSLLYADSTFYHEDTNIVTCRERPTSQSTLTYVGKLQECWEFSMGLLVSFCCCYKLPQTQWLKMTQIYCLTPWRSEVQK